VKKHLGIVDGELSGKPYAKYWNPKMAPLPPHAHEALAMGPLAAELLPDVGQTSDIENGYGLWPDGSLHVAIRTDLPKVTFAMIEWWFAWHSDEPERYKLWHPRAHVCAEWKDTGNGYLNRTSRVDEYIGSELSHVEISFRQPPIANSIFARIGMSQLEVGWLLHEIRDRIARRAKRARLRRRDRQIGRRQIERFDGREIARGQVDRHVRERPVIAAAHEENPAKLFHGVLLQRNAKLARVFRKIDAQLIPGAPGRDKRGATDLAAEAVGILGPPEV
jgi:hypothetical protein